MLATVIHVIPNLLEIGKNTVKIFVLLISNLQQPVWLVWLVKRKMI